MIKVSELLKMIFPPPIEIASRLEASPLVPARAIDVEDLDRLPDGYYRTRSFEVVGIARSGDALYRTFGGNTPSSIPLSWRVDGLYRRDGENHPFDLVEYLGERAP